MGDPNPFNGAAGDRLYDPAEVTSLLDRLQQARDAALASMTSTSADAAAPVAEIPAADTAVPEMSLTSGPVQEIDSELWQVLAQELPELERELAEALAAARGSREAAEHYIDLLGRLGLASEAIGLEPFCMFIERLAECVRGNVERVEGLSDDDVAVLGELPLLLRSYFGSPGVPAPGAELAALLVRPSWQNAAAEGEIEVIARMLATVKLVDRTAEKPKRPTVATPADVSLVLPRDLNEELFEGLVSELPIQTEEFSAAVHRVADGRGFVSDIEVAKRAAHTLKGAANTVGVRGVANLTHHLEDILLALSQAEVMPGPALAEMLVAAADSLEGMSEAVLGTGPAPTDAVDVLQQVLDWANRIDREGVAVSAAAARPERPAHAAAGVDEAAESSVDTDPAAESSAPLAQQVPMVRIPAGLVDELLRLAGETIIATGQIRERVRTSARQAEELRDQSSIFRQIAVDLDRLVEARSDAARNQRVAGSEGFDPLEFEHYSELHMVSRRLAEAAVDAAEMGSDVVQDVATLGELVEEQGRINSVSQQTVLRTRMVPVRSVVARFHRSVRQTARLLDKQVELAVSGAEVEIDSNMLNAVVDPLMHVLRNAVDHGIEEAHERKARGKPAAGRIDLEFRREGSSIAIRCRDDGRGLDLEAIRRTGEMRGLLEPGQDVSEQELSRLILQPGFSTRQETTQVSGRGIGLDVVNSRVVELKGTVSLTSHPGEGLLIELRLPATLVSSHALLVRVGRHRVALASRGIEDIQYAAQTQFETIGSGLAYRTGDKLLPLTDLDVVLGMGDDDRRKRDRIDGFPVLVVKLDTGEGRAIRVQEVIDSLDVVTKALGSYVPKIRGVAGATILGDGRVAPVIDLPDMLKAPAGSVGISHARGADADASAQVRSALVIDDSLSARRATAEFMRDAGFDVRTAIDGMEAVSMLGKWRPDIVLVDLEMPRMNGIEFTTYVRGHDTLKDIPVVMITSRSTDKHRRLAGSSGVDLYFTKPFNNDELRAGIESMLGRKAA